MTLEEGKEVLPMMEAKIRQIKEQQGLMAELVKEGTVNRTDAEAGTDQTGKEGDSLQDCRLSAGMVRRYNDLIYGDIVSGILIRLQSVFLYTRERNLVCRKAVFAMG